MYSEELAFLGVVMKTEPRQVLGEGGRQWDLGLEKPMCPSSRRPYPFSAISSVSQKIMADSES